MLWPRVLVVSQTPTVSCLDGFAAGVLSAASVSILSSGSFSRFAWLKPQSNISEIPWESCCGGEVVLAVLERCLLLDVAAVLLRAGLSELRDGLGLPALARHVQRGARPVILGVDIGAAAEQRLDDLRVAVRRLKRQSAVRNALEIELWWVLVFLAANMSGVSFIALMSVDGWFTSAPSSSATTTSATRPVLAASSSSRPSLAGGFFGMPLPGASVAWRVVVEQMAGSSHAQTDCETVEWIYLRKPAKRLRTSCRRGPGGSGGSLGPGTGLF